MPMTEHCPMRGDCPAPERFTAFLPRSDTLVWHRFLRMPHFVLVAGAWLGSWAWDDVLGALSASGHDATPVTLSGLGDRRGLPVDEVSQSTHVGDIVQAVEQNGLHDVVLVGHSYAGVPVGQAAAQIGDRLRRVVYVDANIPKDGQSFIGGWSERGQQMTTQQICDNDGYWPPLEAADYAGHDLSQEAVATLVERATPHPGLTLTEPARLVKPLSDLPSTYIKCLMAGEKPTEDVQALLGSSTWNLRDVNTGHWPMLSRPAELAALLIAVAEAQDLPWVGECEQPAESAD